MATETQAQKAVTEFNRTGTILPLGQRIITGMGPGDVHVFPDGSIACHWSDGAFMVGDVVED